VAEERGLPARQATEALLAGRFGECERLAAEAAAADPTDIGPGLLVVAVHREQGRAAQAEILQRALLAEHPEHDEPRAMLAAVLADLGRDADARRQLDLIDLRTTTLDVCALASEVAALLRLRSVAEALHARIEPHASMSVGIHGSLARPLGLLSHVLGDWHDAAGHFEVALDANRIAGRPVLVAHTCRHYSAVLRLRGKDGDWDRAVGLLAEATDIYRRLEIDSRAEEAEAILRRSLDSDDQPEMQGAGGPATLRRAAAGWELSYDGRSASAPACAGLDHIASLLTADGRPVHAIDLVAGATADSLREQLVAECRARLGELVAAPDGDPVATSLARAEQDRLEAEVTSLADGAPPSAGEVVDRARRLVTLRICVALELIDRALPDFGRHLRRSIRTGTFCVYESAGRQHWRIQP